MITALAGLWVAASAGAVTYPVDGGNAFTTNAEGWTSTGASCTPSLLCAQSNNYSSSEGNPKGSIESRLDVLANGGEVFEGRGTWRSPSFDAVANGSGSLRYDRRLDVSGLLTLNPSSSIEVVLVNDSTKKSQSLGSDSLTSANSAFATRTIAIADETLSVGDRYHLELRTTTATTQAQVGLTGSVTTRFDNVALKIKNEGPAGSSGSPGVTFPAPPLNQQQVNSLSEKVQWWAETGSKQGGGVLALRRCTIVGTPGRDRIKGSKGNDVICGLGGNDKINGRGGRDIIDGGKGNDRLSGGGKADTLAGLAGKDKPKGGAGRDRIGAGAQRDRLAGNAAADRLHSGGGKDRVSGGPGRDRITGGKRGDRVTKVERGV